MFKVERKMKMREGNKIRSLSIDIETYSSVDLTRSGVYPYAAAKDFQLLLFAYAVDGGQVNIIDLARGEKFPQELIEAIKDDTVIKRAFNAAFERVCLSAYLKEDLGADSWRCTMVQAAALGYPLSLDGVAKALGLPEQKLSEGKELIRFFSLPCKCTKFNGGRVRNLPCHDEEKWHRFKEYCKRDVEVERAIHERLAAFDISAKEQCLYALDQRINDRGVRVDLSLVEAAITCDELYRDNLLRTSEAFTGSLNVKSPGQVKAWLKERGIEVDTLSKKVVEELIREEDDQVSQVLNLRLNLSKTSTKKYEAIKRSVGGDDRVRGLFQFYGASRTGRWAGRLVQVQNLPQNREQDITVARDLIRKGNFEAVELLYPNVPDILSQLIRTAFIPKPEHQFIVADFSAIEARVLSWLAGEKWRMEVFKGHGKIYEASASRMFGVKTEEITKESDLRKKGKIAELALGYGGSVGALTAMGALDMGLKAEELKELVERWRSANSNITKFWWDINSAVLTVLTTGRLQQVGRIKIYRDNICLFLQLPSGRRLSYVNPRIEINKWGSKVISYDGITTGKKWGRIESYGPKFVENIVQAISRDILGEAMERLEKAGYPIVMHIHDEVVIEAPVITEIQEASVLNMVYEIMKETPQWAPGLTLEVDGFHHEFYKK